MANPVLFVSSLCITLLHALGQLWYRQTNLVLSLTVLCGLVTSIWNHGATSRVAQVADRAMMWAGFCADAYLVWSIPHHPRWSLCVASLLAAALLYWTAKALIRWTASTQAKAGSFTNELAHEARRPKRRLRHGDLPHLTAHLTLTATHILLMSAFAH